MYVEQLPSLSWGVFTESGKRRGKEFPTKDDAERWILKIKPGGSFGRPLHCGKKVQL